MNKKSQIETIIVIGVISFVLVVAAYFGSTALNKNIDYIGDSRYKVVYPTSKCIELINNIPAKDRVAFDDREDAIDEGYKFYEDCS